MIPKKILIDLSPLRLGPCGLSEYARQFGKQIAKQNNFAEFEITLIVPKNDEFTKSDFMRVKTISFWNRFFNGWLNKFDLVHTISYPSSYLPTKKFKGKWLATLHDLNFLYEKTDLKIKKYLRLYQRYLNRVDHLICISNYAMNDVKSQLRFNAPISIIYNGVSINDSFKNSFQDYNKFSPYLLSVSTFMRKKNLDKLVPMMKNLPQYKLLIAGRVIHKSYFDEVRREVENLGLTNRVFFLGEISDEQKNYLYQYCDGYVFPSFAEGFGIPPIEAMLYGKPVFASTKTSIPEICGDLTFYWQNFDPGEMANKIKEGMEIYNQTPGYSDQLKEFASRYSWEENVDQHLNLYRRLLKSK